MRSYIKRELWWFAVGFGIPFLTLGLAELLTTPSNLSIWERITGPEDICSYGICFVLPTAAYIVVLSIRFLASVR